MTHPIPVAGGYVGIPLGFGVTLDALSFNLGVVDINGVEAFVTDVSGWDSPTLKDDVQSRTRAHGAYRGQSFYGPRLVTLTGFLFSPLGVEALAVARDRLHYATDLTDVDALLTISQTTPRTALVRRAGALLLDSVSPNEEKFSLALSAVDPRRYGTVTRSVTLTNGQRADASNPGTFRGGAPLVAVFTGSNGPATLTVGAEQISFANLNGLTGTVDTLENTVRYSDGSSAYGALVPGSRFPTLAALTTTPLSYSGSGSVTVTWRDTYL